MYGRGFGRGYQFAEWDVFDDPNWMIPEALAFGGTYKGDDVFLDMFTLVFISDLVLFNEIS